MLFSSTLRSLMYSLKRHGLRATIGAIPFYIKYRIRTYSYYRKYSKGMKTDDFDEVHGTETWRVVEGFEMDVVGKKGEAIYRCETITTTETRGILNALPLTNPEEYVFLDVGSGKGKVLLLASEMPFKRIVGVDISRACIETARRNIEIYKGGACKHRFDLHCADIEDFELPSEPTVLYMFNPFPRPVMERFLAKLERSLQEHPRRILLAYVNPAQQDVLRKAGFLNFLKNVPGCLRGTCIFESDTAAPEEVE